MWDFSGLSSLSAGGILVEAAAGIRSFAGVAAIVADAELPCFHSSFLPSFVALVITWVSMERESRFRARVRLKVRVIS